MNDLRRFCHYKNRRRKKRREEEEEEEEEEQRKRKQKQGIEEIMEGKKEMGSSSSSSLASELFGAKDSTPSSSTGIFSSIFAPPSKGLGRESLRHDPITNKPYQPNETWNPKSGTYGDGYKGYEGDGQNNPRVQPYGPCHLSSSIYYGGPDVVSNPQTTPSSGYKKDSTEDDSGSACRGNWWQGSLYY